MIEHTFITLGRLLGKPPGWERCVRRFCPPEQCGRLRQRTVKTARGLTFPADPATYLGWQVLFFRTYEPEIRSVISSLLKPGGAAIDVGANVGWHTLLMGSLVGDSGRVLAFEPNPPVRERLADNIKINGLHCVSIFDCALSDRHCEMQFVAPQARRLESGNGHLMDDEKDSQGVTDLIGVLCETIDRIVQREQLKRLDLIKIDVEGWEWPVLRGASRTLERLRPVVIFEFISEYLARGKGSQQELSEFLASLGYHPYSLGRRRPRPIGREWPVSTNILAVPEEILASGTGQAILL